jgi:hypothetical protein
MTVWTLESAMDYEGCELLGVYSNKELARKAAGELPRPMSYEQYVVSEVELDGAVGASWETEDGKEWKRRQT